MNIFKKMNKKKLVKGFGILLALVILGFMIAEFVENWNEMKHYLVNVKLPMLFGAILIYAAAFLATGYNWASILWHMTFQTNEKKSSVNKAEQNGKMNVKTYPKFPKLSRKDYLNIHMVSALARYMPGGIWNIVGKAYMCTQKGVEKSATTASMILEYVFQIISSGLFLLCFLPVLFHKYLNDWWIAGIIVIFIIILLLLPWAVGVGTNLLGKLFKENLESVRLSKMYIYKVLLQYIAVWLLTGVGLILLVLAFSKTDFLQGVYLVLSYPISWVTGFLSPSPNGMGVREGVLKILLDGRYSEELLLLITLTSRIWTILGEAAAFIGFQLYYFATSPHRKYVSDNVFQTQQALFISTKNIDYLRNTQEIRMLKEKEYEVTIIASASSSYFKRLLFVYTRLLWTSVSPYSLIFIGFAPQLVLPFFSWKFKGKPLTIDFFISMYDTLVFDRKKIKQGTFFAKFLKWWDTITIQRADQVISDTKTHGQYFMEEFGLKKERLQTYYLEADTSIYYLRGEKKLPNMQNKFIVLYFGSILPLQGVDIVLKSAEILKYRKDIHFVIIGPLKKEDQIPNSDTITYHTWLSQEELAIEIERSDLCLAGHFNKDIPKAKRTIPGKAYIYYAMGRPMILGDNRANHERYEEAMDGIFYVPMGDAHALAQEILRIKEQYTNEVNYTDTML